MYLTMKDTLQLIACVCVCMHLCVSNACTRVFVLVYIIVHFKIDFLCLNTYGSTAYVKYPKKET